MRTVAQQSPKVKADEFRDLLSRWVNFFEDKTKRVVYLAYKKGANQSEVADALEVSRERVSQKYPYLKGGE